MGQSEIIMTKEFAVPQTVAPGCRRCEVLPPQISGPGTLHLRFPLGHSQGKIVTFVRQSGWEFSHQDDLLSIVVHDADLASTVLPISRHLTSTELDDVRALFQPEGELLQWQNFFEVDSLRVFTAKAQSGWLLSLLKEKRLQTWFQPIVECNDSANVFGYECLMRGDDGGQLVFPDRILEVARGAGLLFQLDRAARVTSITNAAKFNLQSKIFINFTPTSIYDPVNCLQTTVKAVDASHLKREQVVFEVIESDQVDDPNFLRDILDFYRDQGFQVALDDIGSGYSSLNLLNRIRPDYIKLDRELSTGVHTDSYKGLIAAKILEVAHELEIPTIAEGVETVEEFMWLRDHGANYVQGYLFAKPTTPPPVPKTLEALASSA